MIPKGVLRLSSYHFENKLCTGFAGWKKIKAVHKTKMTEIKNLRVHLVADTREDDSVLLAVSSPRGESKGL